MCRKRLIPVMLLALSLPVAGENPEILTLESCRSMAVSNNKELRMADMQREVAHYNCKSAFTAYLPKVSATGMYMHTDKEVSLLSDDQKTTLSHMGDGLGVPVLNSLGQGLVDALRTDTRNMGGAAVMLTQPIYMGGKIRAYNSMTRYAERIAADKRNLAYQDLIVSVDETYWSIVQLAARKRLAESYRELVRTLDNDVEQMIGEGFATKADGLSVKVKVNEANVAVIQVDNGLELLKMRMCQLCGLPLDSSIVLADENGDSLSAIEDCGNENINEWENRPELSALEASIGVSKEKIKLARAEFMPTVALTGGYLATYPSVFNSFEKKFKGTWNIGVAVNIPILTWGDRYYKVRAAKAQAALTKFSYEETREKIELQVSQSRQKVREAQERVMACQSSQAEADENLRYASLGVKEGVIPVSNLLEAQTAWVSAKSGLIAADIDLRLANLYLKKSLGTIIE